MVFLDNKKTARDRREEERLIKEMIDLVEKRNTLLEQLEEERLR